MDALSTASGVLGEHPVLRGGLAALAGLGLAVMPFEAMDADPIEGDSSQHITEYNEECKSGCDPDKEICCNDPI